MGIQKNSLPILEYDSDPEAILMPAHEGLDVQLPRRAVLAFLDGCVDECAAREGWQTAMHFDSIVKRYPVYVARHGGEEICVFRMPVGAAAAAQILDWLIGYGVRQAVAVGSCGALADLPENAFLVPERALRDEGTSYHYLPPARTVETDAAVRCAIEEALDAAGLPWSECMTWTTDGFFRETKALTAYRREEGCTVVEMECAALAACAKLRGAAFGQLLFTADSLANAERHEGREWGCASFQPALRLGLEAARRIK